MIPAHSTPIAPVKQAARPRPSALPVIVENLPAELRERPQWVVWRYIWQDERDDWAKIPHNAKSGRYAEPDNPKTWTTFDAALSAYQTGRWDGLGYVFSEDDPFVGVDLDDCRNPETEVIEPWAVSLLGELDTYCEISPSGTGLKAICKGTWPVRGKRRGNVEVYRSGRYFALTGHVRTWTRSEIVDAQAALDALWGKWNVETAKTTTGGGQGAGPVFVGDSEVIRRIECSTRRRDAEKFSRLFDGDTSGYKSASEADLALCNLLAFYSGGDAGQVDRVFQQSALYRPKWDKVHRPDGATYGAMTVAKAMERDRFYDPNYRSDAPPPAKPPDLTAPADLPPPSHDDVLAALARGELGDAELLAARWAGRIAYDHAEQGWHTWTGHCWQRDERKQVDALPGTKLAALYLASAADAAKSDDRKQADALSERARLLWRRNRIANILHLAARQDALSLSGREWDAQPWLLAVKNGVIDLHTGDLRPGQPGDHLRTRAPTEWGGLDAPAPRWERFLSEVFDGDDDLIAFVQRLLGYAITGLSTEHVLPILWGKGRNGKDTLLKALSHALGPGFADAVPEEVFIDAGRANGGNAQPHVYKLRGLRLAWASETEEGARLKAGQVKLISGGGVLTARPLYGAPVSWEATHTVLLITNHRPHVSADDYAMWKRIVLIPFALSFVDEPKDANERQRDLNLDAKLKAEAPGILAWLVRGCLAWQSEGLRPPECVKTATESYRSDEDTLGQWLAECCIVGDNYTCRAQAAYRSYDAWCTEMHLRALTGTSFGKKISERFRKEHTRNGWQYVGIGLLTDQSP